MEKPIKTVPIAGGNLLEIHDLSHNITKDIWELKSLFRAKIRIEEGMFTPEDLRTIRVAELMEALGQTVLFEVIRERKFIHEKDKDKSFQGLVDDFLKNSGSYLLDPGFPRKIRTSKISRIPKREHSLDTLKGTQILFNAIQPLLDVLKGICVGKPQKTFRVLSEIDSRRDPDTCFFKDVEGQIIGI